MHYIKMRDEKKYIKEVLSSLFAFLSTVVVLFELINMSLNIFFEREYDINDIYV